MVTDVETGESIPFANVVILGTQIGTATQEDGNFYILNIPPDVYTVEVSCVGYQTQEITNVVVKIDQTVRLTVRLEQSPIEIEPITVTHEPPAVTKDMTGTTYILRESDVTTLPIDYADKLISFQPSVARTESTLHVRGGRATEVNYMIDNVSIIDPQTGEPAIIVSKSIINEVIFLPGGFDAEYGRAMSGVVNVITQYPKDKLNAKTYGKTERIIPYYYDFGYENLQTSIHVPVSEKNKGVFSFDIMYTDDWDPKLYKLPHKQRDDYAFYGKWFFVPSGKFTLSLSGANSRSQFDNYPSIFKAKFRHDHWRSDLRKGYLGVFNVSYMPDARKFFNVTLSQLFTTKELGVRDEGPFGLFEDFTFRDYTTYERWNIGNKNPFGVFTTFLFSQGDYGVYQDKASRILKGGVNSNLQIHKYHELKAGFEYIDQNFESFTYLTSDTAGLLIDDYVFQPKEYSIFLQDNIDYKGLYVKIGGRYDYFSTEIEGIQPKSLLSPRFGFSFMLTERFLFRANIGKYVQPPLYEHMYNLYILLPLPSHVQGIPPVGNPDLEPEKTMSYEVGMQGAIRDDFTVSLNVFHKDVTDLTGTRWFTALPRSYPKYFNVEYSNIHGIETILDFSTKVFTGRVSYTLSWAKGTSSYADEVYDRYYAEDPDPGFIPPAEEYYLDFDQRHRIFLQGTTNLPKNIKMHVFGFIGQGFPYTPPGFEGKYSERNIVRLPFKRQIDCLLTRPFRIGKLTLAAHLEIINVLDLRYQIAPVYYPIALESIDPGDFTDFIPIGAPYYHPAADFNHDGLITPYEEYTAYRASVIAACDWPNAYTAPRRARLGITLTFN